MKIRYLTHPQVVMDPAVPVPRWPLNATGIARIQRLAGSGRLHGTSVIFSSCEVKAVQGSETLARALNCRVENHAALGENDRSATGYLPTLEFERAADQFFSEPGRSFRGWETAQAAQNRIVQAVQACLRDHQDGDVLFVGHGAVGTLLWCHLNQVAISRAHDQFAGGGCFFEFTKEMTGPVVRWQPMEKL